MSERPPPRRQDQLTLAALLTAVCCARLFVRYGLREWHVAREYVELAERLVAKIATNTVRATGITSPAADVHRGPSRPEAPRIRLLLFEESVVIQVWDTSPEPPQPAAQGADVNPGLSRVAGGEPGG
jgi:hypothetical protein